MSDFGAGASDFHSDFASDFRTEWNDYASDFASDFGGEPRTAKQPPEATETAPPEHGTAADKDTVDKGGGKLAAHRTSSKPRSSWKRHAIRPQTTRTVQEWRRRYKYSHKH